MKIYQKEDIDDLFAEIIKIKSQLVEAKSFISNIQFDLELGFNHSILHRFIT